VGVRGGRRRSVIFERGEEADRFLDAVHADCDGVHLRTGEHD